MFTGLIGEIGKIEACVRSTDLTDLTVQAPGMTAAGIRPGDSLALNGICLTVTRLDPPFLQVQAVRETRTVTTLSEWRPGRRINLERALAWGDRLDGHLVTGHVDGLAVVRAVIPEGPGRRVRLSAPAELRVYLPRKGSVALDGTSLTIAEAADETFDVALIPFTLDRTTAADWVPGQQVNLEVDVIARYLERLQGGRTPEGGLTWERLRAAGF